MKRLDDVSRLRADPRHFSLIVITSLSVQKRFARLFVVKRVQIPPSLSLPYDQSVMVGPADETSFEAPSLWIEVVVAKLELVGGVESDFESGEGSWMVKAVERLSDDSSAGAPLALLCSIMTRYCLPEAESSATMTALSC